MARTEDVKRIETEAGNTIDASARIINVAPPVNSGDAGTKAYVDSAAATGTDFVTDQISALNMDEVVRNIGSEIDAVSARIKNLSNARLTNQGDAVNVASVKLIFADTAPTVDLISIDLITPSLATLSDVTPILQRLAEAINALENGLDTQQVIVTNPT